MRGGVGWFLGMGMGCGTAAARGRGMAGRKIRADGMRSDGPDSLADDLRALEHLRVPFVASIPDESTSVGR